MGSASAVPIVQAKPGFASDVGDRVAELDVHLHQRRLHVLYAARLIAQQHRALPRVGAQHAHRFARPIGAAQQTVAQQLLQPLAIQHIALTAADVLDVPGIDQQHFNAARFEQLEEGNSVRLG